MTDDELGKMLERHQHDHAEDGGLACPSCEADVPKLVAEVRRAAEIIRSIIWASNHCQGHAACAHAMTPWIDAREFLYEFENEQEALTELRRRRHGDYGRTGPIK